MSEDKRSGGNDAFARAGTRESFCNWAVSQKGKDPTQRRDGRITNKKISLHSPCERAMIDGRPVGTADMRDEMNELCDRAKEAGGERIRWPWP